MTYTESDLEPMARDSLIRIILKLQRENGEKDEVIAYARTEIQAMAGCQGWDSNWCYTSCKWWKLCQPMEESGVE